MPVRGSCFIPNEVTKTLICVNDTALSEISGIILNPYMKKPIKFKSIKQLMDIMEKFFEDICYPQSFYAERSFTAPKLLPAIKKGKEVKRYMSDDIFIDEQGKKATFVVQVHFRQNASWQGSITWTEQKKTQHFRSTLEMIKLMDNALEEENEKAANNTPWE